MKGDETFALPVTSTPFVMTSGRAGSSSAVIRAGSNVPPAPALPCVLQWFRRIFLLFFFFPGSPTVWLGVLVLIPHRLVRPAFLASSPLVLLLPAAPSPSGRSRAPLFAAQASRLGRSACPSRTARTARGVRSARLLVLRRAVARPFLAPHASLSSLASPNAYGCVLTSRVRPRRAVRPEGHPRPSARALSDTQSNARLLGSSMSASGTKTWHTDHV